MDLVFQFKVSLIGIRPMIWRRIQIRDIFTFWDFHVAIQDAMGWYDCHLHQFRIKNPQTGAIETIGVPTGMDFDEPTIPGWRRRIADYFTADNKVCEYEYDFGDCCQRELIALII